MSTLPPAVQLRMKQLAAESDRQCKEMFDQQYAILAQVCPHCAGHLVRRSETWTATLWRYLRGVGLYFDDTIEHVCEDCGRHATWTGRISGD